MAVLLATTVCGVASPRPRNVIFMIGDGMGPEQVKAANYYNGGPLVFETFLHQGLLRTYAANASVTDSAAGGTALATGVKVNNGVISMAYPGDGRELQTLLEHYQAAGKSAGLVSTTYLTHATPAAFGAHEPSRGNTSQIAGDYMNQTRPNVLFGGGGSGMSTSTAAAKGYTVVTNRVGMQGLNTETETMVSGQFGSGHMPYEYDGNYTSLPHLSEMTNTALSILDNDPDGFFLMVEGGRIDHAGHMSNSNPDLKTRRNVGETIEFANAAQVALNWAAGRTDTLIIVTADHETGDLTVTGDNGAGVYPSVYWGSTGHTATNVPVYAWGPNAHLVNGVMDNTDMFAIATVPGDANGNGFVDDTDLAILLANWEQNPSTITTWQLGNFTQNSAGDTDVDDDDLAVLLANWTGAPPPGGAAVPEPATLALLALGGLAMIRRRRR